MQKPIDLKSKLDRISAVVPVLKAINGIIKLSPNNPQHREWFEEDNKKENN